MAAVPMPQIWLQMPPHYGFKSASWSQSCHVQHSNPCSWLLSLDSSYEACSHLGKISGLVSQSAYRTTGHHQHMHRPGLPTSVQNWQHWSHLFLMSWGPCSQSQAKMPSCPNRQHLHRQCRWILTTRDCLWISRAQASHMPHWLACLRMTSD